MVSVSATLAHVLRQGMAVFLRPGHHQLEDSHTVVGWAKAQPGNIVIEDTCGKRTVINQEETVYLPKDVIL